MTAELSFRRPTEADYPGIASVVDEWWGGRRIRVRVYVDQGSVKLLQGSEIDYVDTLMGAGFTVNNPNAMTACGCGSSFRTADDSGQARACAH